jgi:hypothetical protein
VLPSFYVLDSIVKNVKGAYVDLFGADLKDLFFNAFYRMPDGRTRLCHLLDTWKGVFSDEVVASIRSSLPAAGRPAVAAPPPEKRVKLDSVIMEQERAIEMQTVQMMNELEHQVRIKKIFKREHV